MKKLVLALFICLSTLHLMAQSQVCRLLKDVPHSLKIIKDSAHRIFHSATDACVYQLMDSLENRFIKTHKKEYLVCLDSICWNCSPDVQEKHSDTALFYGSFKPFIDYLYNNGDTINCLEINLEYGFGFETIEDPNDLYDAKKRFNTFIKEQETKDKFPDGEKRFIELIRQRVEALTLDDKE
jgi:hypothetical protein